MDVSGPKYVYMLVRSAQRPLYQLHLYLQLPMCVVLPCAVNIHVNRVAPPVPQAAEKFKAPEASTVAMKEAEQETAPVEESEGEEVRKQ